MQIDKAHDPQTSTTSSMGSGTPTDETTLPPVSEDTTIPSMDSVTIGEVKYNDNPREFIQPLSPHEEEVAHKQHRESERVLNRERRQLHVDSIIRRYNLQVSTSIRPNLRPLDYTTQIIGLEDQIGQIHVLVTDGVITWARFGDGRIEIVHFDNLVDKSNPEDKNDKEKKKLGRASIRQDIRDIEREIINLEFQHELVMKMVERKIVTEDVGNGIKATIAQRKVALRSANEQLEKMKGNR